MTDISSRTIINKRSIRELLSGRTKYSVVLTADGRDTPVSFSAGTRDHVSERRIELARNGLELLRELRLLDGIERETFRIKHRLEPLPTRGDHVELTDDIGPYEKGSIMRVVTASYVPDIMSTENLYPVTLLPEDEYGVAKGVDPELVLGIPVNIDEYKVLDAAMVAA